MLISECEDIFYFYSSTSFSFSCSRQRIGNLFKNWPTLRLKCPRSWHNRCKPGVRGEYLSPTPCACLISNNVDISSCPMSSYKASHFFLSFFFQLYARFTLFPVGLGIMPLQLLNLGVIIPRFFFRVFYTRTPRGKTFLDHRSYQN